MRLDHITRVCVAMFPVGVLLAPLTPNASAKADSVPVLTPAVMWLADGAMVLLVCALWSGLLVGAMEAFDCWCERRAEWGAHLRARIVTALQHDRLLGSLPVTPIVHLPLWGRSQAAIELRGQVPTLWLRHAVLRAAEREAAASAAACYILDRIAIVPSGRA